MAGKQEFDEVVIEYPSAGTTYSREEFGVYGYGTYPRSSVLAGQTRRVYLGSYATLAEARQAHPEATRVQNSSGYEPPDLSHLPGEDDPDPTESWDLGTYHR